MSIEAKLSEPREAQVVKTFLQRKVTRRNAIKGAGTALVTIGMGGLTHSAREIDDIKKEANNITLPNSPMVDGDLFRADYVSKEKDKRNVNTVSFASLATAAAGGMIFLGDWFCNALREGQKDSSSQPESQTPDQTR